jgi:phosphinothricin acetyltransferase
MDLQIRDMTEDDWPRVSEIYFEGIETERATFETVVPSWELWDQGHLGTPRLVATEGGHIVGWAALSPVSQRAVYAGVAEVSVYVAGAMRGRGIGRALLNRLSEASERNGIWTLQAGIFAGNEASIALHRRCGFRVVGVRERIGWLHGAWHDVVLMERRSAAVGIEPARKGE